MYKNVLARVCDLLVTSCSTILDFRGPRFEFNDAVDDIRQLLVSSDVRAPFIESTVNDPAGVYRSFFFERGPSRH